jgi:hypothetical protein
VPRAFRQVEIRVGEKINQRHNGSYNPSLGDLKVINPSKADEPLPVDDLVFVKILKEGPP